MLPTTHKNILKIWVNLLQDFHKILSEQKADLINIQTQWQEIQSYLKSHIMSIDCDNFPVEKKSVWQTWQTETYRYVRLLNTELLFFYSAKQTKVQETRLLGIKQKLEKMIQLTNNLT